MSLSCDSVKTSGVITKLLWHLISVSSKPHLEILTETAKTIQGGKDSPQPTNRGVYGYISFGVLSGSVIFWFPPQYINWDNQVFWAPGTDCNCVRMWLRPGVIGRVVESVEQFLWNPPHP